MIEKKIVRKCDRCGREICSYAGDDDFENAESIATVDFHPNFGKGATVEVAIDYNDLCDNCAKMILEDLKRIKRSPEHGRRRKKKTLVEETTV